MKTSSFRIANCQPVPSRTSTCLAAHIHERVVELETALIRSMTARRSASGFGRRSVCAESLPALIKWSMSPAVHHSSSNGVARGSSARLLRRLGGGGCGLRGFGRPVPQSAPPPAAAPPTAAAGFRSRRMRRHCGVGSSNACAATSRELHACSVRTRRASSSQSKIQEA